MTKVNIITPPDVLHNTALSFLLVQPSNDIRLQFQSLLAKFERHINVYFYAPETDEERDIAWLTTTANFVDYVILDVDNLDYIERSLSSYFIGLPQTYYLTNSNDIPYNLISTNRIYNLDWLYEKLIEEE